MFFDDPAKVTPRFTGVTFSPVHLCHMLLCHLCVCVHFRRVFESQHGVFTSVVTSGYTDPHTAHSTHIKHAHKQPGKHQEPGMNVQDEQEVQQKTNHKHVRPMQRLSVHVMTHEIENYGDNSPLLQNR